MLNKNEKIKILSILEQSEYFFGLDNVDVTEEDIDLDLLIKENLNGHLIYITTLILTIKDERLDEKEKQIINKIIENGCDAFNNKILIFRELTENKKTKEELDKINEEMKKIKEGLK